MISCSNPNKRMMVTGEECKLFKGEWVPDLNGSSYTNTGCSTIPDSKNCLKNGRKDREFMEWRWKPNGCELPRFDPKKFMKTVRGKKMGFIGDSVARNHLESLLCLLSKEEVPIDVYKDSEDKFRAWHFPYHDFTVTMLWSEFLVTGNEIIVNGSKSGIFDLHLDQIDQKWARELPTLDYAIISAGHWFFRQIHLYSNSIQIGCVYCNHPNITNRGFEFAFRMSFRAALKYINNCTECNGITTLVRTFSPAHFENGTWDNGGSCNRVRPHGESEVELGGFYLELRRVQYEEIERARIRKKKMEKKRFEVLDVTRAMLMRGDGHPGAYWGNKWMKGYNDCVHWCLPGPIDVWNDFLMAILNN